MAYELKREEGTVIGEKQFKIPRTEKVVIGEVRNHSLASGDVCAVWYKSDDEWKIFLAGDTARRFVK